MDKNKLSLTWLLRVTIGILLIFGFTAGYYWSHKPIELPAFVVLAQTFFSILVWLIVVWIAAAMGGKILPRHLFEENGITYLALSTGLGLGIISLLAFTLGILGLLSPWIAWLSLLTSAVFFREQLKVIFSELKTIELPKPQNTLEKWIWAFGILMFTTTFIQALTPPTAWDSLVYHLTGPKLYIESGRIGHPLNNHYLGFPPLGSMQFMYAMLLAGERAAALFHFTYGILALLVTGEIAKRYLGTEVAWHTVLILLSIPTIFNLISVPYTDGTLLFYATASFYVFLRWREEQVNDWLLPLGIMLGFCVGVKYTAAAVPITIALLLLSVSRRAGMAKTLHRLGTITIVALLVSLPYLLENLFSTGNPFYPFLFDEGLYWDQWRTAFYDRPGTGFAATAPLRLLIAPIEATIFGIEGAGGFGANIGPFLFPVIFLLPLAWAYINKDEQKTLGYLFFFIGINYALWLSGLARSALLLQSRLLLPMFGVMAVVGGLALARIKKLTRPQLEFRWLINTILYINIALLMVTAALGFLNANPIPVTVGLESKRDYLQRRLGLYTIVIDAVNQLPQDSRVLFLWEPRSYHCEVECWPDALLDNFLHQTRYYQRDAASIATDWHQQGFTHILFFKAGMVAATEIGHDHIEPEDLAILEGLQENELRLLEDFNGDYQLFELEERK